MRIPQLDKPICGQCEQAAGLQMILDISDFCVLCSPSRPHQIIACMHMHLESCRHHCPTAKWLIACKHRVVSRVKLSRSSLYACCTHRALRLTDMQTRMRVDQ